MRCLLWRFLESRAVPQHGFVSDGKDTPSNETPLPPE
jgi:hypothetical protein